MITSGCGTPRRVGPPKDRLLAPRPLVTYTGVLPIGEHTAVAWRSFLSAQRREHRTRRDRRVLGPWRHAVLVLRWFLGAEASLASQAPAASGGCAVAAT